MLSLPTGRAVKTVCVLAAAALTILWEPVPAKASGVICLMTDSETGQCRLEARWEQADGGPVTLSITAGGGEVLQNCPRPRRTVSDALQGPAVVPCWGGESMGWYSATYDCYFIGDRRN